MSSSIIPVETSRLYLDSFIPEDYTVFHQILDSQEYQKFNSDEFHSVESEGIKYYVLDLCKQNYKVPQAPFVLAVRLKQTRECIGFIGLTNGELTADSSIEVYFSIHKKFWNRGFATEALKGILEWAFSKLKLHRIFAGTDMDNIASRTVMEKAGMRFESRWRKDRIRQGKRCDGLGFAILKDDPVA